MPWARSTIVARAWSGVPGHEGVDERVHRPRVERIEGDAHPIATGPESGTALLDLGSGEHEHEDRLVAGPVDEVIEEVEQLVVGVVGVLDQEHHRVGASPAARRTAASRRTAPRARELRTGVARYRDAEQASDPGPDEQPIVDVGDVPLEPARQLDRGDLRRILLGDAEALADDLGERPEHQALAVRQTAAAVPAASPRRGRRRTSRTPSRCVTCRHRQARTRAPVAAAGVRPRHGTSRGSSASRRRVRSAAPRARRRAARRRRSTRPVRPATGAAARSCP